jgi:hypothetical protein
MILESNKTQYRPNEEIVLTLKPDWDRPLHKEIRDSLSFWVTESRVGSALLRSKAKTFSEGDQTIGDQDFEVWRKGQPIQITGRISSIGDGISVAFDGFGGFQASVPATLRLGFWYSPVRPGPLDPLEDYSNEITIEVVR